jgi:hypothetical protein
VVLALGVVAGLAWLVTMINGNQEAGSFAMIGVLAVFGGFFWVISSIGAWLMQIVAQDVREDMS